MTNHEGIAGLRELPRGVVLSIGNFDGVHRGHLRIIDVARELRARTAGATLALVTFEPHPLTVLRPELAPARLTSSAAKRALLAAVGVDHLVVLPPTHEVLDLTAEEFFAILRDDVQAAHLVEGDSFNFGKDRGGTITQLREWTRESSIALHVIDPVQVALRDMQIADVNSSLIRWLIARGRMRDAGICLGRPYALQGEVIEGFKRGRQIGVPTANLNVVDQLIPADGVYAGRCLADHHTHTCAISIGTLPTFDGAARQIEAHLIGFDGDLYGRTISVDCVDWIRDQQKFSSVDALKVQLARDLRSAKRQARIDVSESWAIAPDVTHVSSSPSHA